MKASVSEFLAKIPYSQSEQWLEGVPFVNAFAHGTMSVELFKPKKADYQTPHDQDEIYVVVSGSGEFLRGKERMTFEAGDVLFVPAGMFHRFENFTEDFVTWVIFYGEKGGE